MRDAIVLSSWNWDVFNVPERVALALASRGARVLYCGMPRSRFRGGKGDGRGLHRVHPRIDAFTPEYLGEKFSGVGFLRDWQWKKVAQDILQRAKELILRDPVFIYSHVKHLAPLCREIRATGLMLVHVCMDYPEDYQDELIELSDRTLVIPRTVFHDLRQKHNGKIEWIPQSIHLDGENRDAAAATPRTQEFPPLVSVPHPRLGYLGPLHGRVNVDLMRSALGSHPRWHFVCFGGAELLPVENAHGLPWMDASQTRQCVASFDIGVMPYRLSDPKNLHCVPLKLFDYFLAGLPVVSTRILSLDEYRDLIYFGDSPSEFADAIESALREPADSEKREARRQVARAHSTDALGRRLEELLMSEKAQL